MNKNRVLNVEFIQEKLDEGYHYTEESRGRDLVLVIGNTGVGKSTTCNYLLGHRMKELTYKGRPVIDTVDETDIKIGHEVKAETLYAKSYVINKNSVEYENGNDRVCLLDCPGFFGNRTVEDKVIESISTELAIRSAGQVKGILILISLNILMETRVKELRELVSTLIYLFKDPVEMVKYSVFIVTKKYHFMPLDHAKDITFGALRSLKDYSEGQANSLRENPNLGSCDNLTCIDYDRISTYFSAVLEKKDDIIFIDPLDNGLSRKLILDQINGIKPRKGYFKEMGRSGINVAKKAVGIKSEPTVRPITIDDFSFSEGNEDRIKFIKALLDRAREGINFITEIKRCYKTNRNLHCEILNCNKRLFTLQSLMCSLEEEIRKADEEKSQHSKIDFESLRVFESMIIENDKQIESKQKEIADDDVRIKRLDEQLQKIDVCTPILFIKKSICKNVPWWKFFGWEVMNFEADTNDTETAIIKVEKEIENGHWENETDEREKGIYKIRYVSNYLARPAKASVKTYIKTNETANNKISIEKMKINLNDLKQRQSRIKSEIESLILKNQALQASVIQGKISKEEYKHSLKLKLEECKSDIQRLHAEIAQKEEQRKQSRHSGIIYLQEFSGNRLKYDIVVSIAALLELSSMLIKRFIFEYNEFLSKGDEYMHRFGDSTTDCVPCMYEEDNNDEESLKDPITGNEIKDLVITSAGTAFDEHSLLKQFDNNLENPMPFIFKREDGSNEEIEFLSWQKVPDIQNYIEKLRSRSHQNSSNLSSVVPHLAFIGPEINKLSIEQLELQEDNLFKEIKKMKEDIEAKETDLQKISSCRERLLLEAQRHKSPESSVPLPESSSVALPESSVSPESSSVPLPEESELLP